MIICEYPASCRGQPDMMIFTYVGLSGATLGTAIGAMLITLGVMNVDPPQLADMRFTTEEAHALVHTFPAERMRIVQSGAEKKDWLGAERPKTAALL